MSAYASSKGAVIILTKALAQELAPDNIRVNCISPMITETPLIKLIPEEVRKVEASTAPLGRLAKPEDVAYAALYLASDESSMITGMNIRVDGGIGSRY
jgi:3-oxoacyl-[acyl-carrier protein] reductase